MSFTIRCEVMGRPPTMNAHRSANHWSANAGSIREWRDCFAVLARAQRLAPVDGVVGITSTPSYPNRRSLPDPMGTAPATKAAIDGLRDAGVLVDDTGDQVAWITSMAPVVDGGPPALTLRVEVIE